MDEAGATSNFCPERTHVGNSLIFVYLFSYLTSRVLEETGIMSGAHATYKIILSYDIEQKVAVKQTSKQMYLHNIITGIHLKKKENSKVVEVSIAHTPSS